MYQQVFLIGTIHLVFHDEAGYSMLVSSKRRYMDEKDEIHEEIAKIEVHYDEKKAKLVGPRLNKDARVVVRGYVVGTDQGNPLIITPVDGSVPFARMSIEAQSIKVVGKATDDDGEDDDLTWILVGRLGREPEMKYMPDGETAVTNFSIAVDNFPAPGVRKTIWVRCAAWGNNAETANKLSTGKAVLVEVRPIFDDGTWRIWHRTTGEPGASFEATVMRLRFLEKRDTEASTMPMQQEVESSGDLW